MAALKGEKPRKVPDLPSGKMQGTTLKSAEAYKRTVELHKQFGSCIEGLENVETFKA
jgi:hypothetical protein